MEPGGDLLPEPIVRLVTTSIDLCIEKIDELGSSINPDSNWYDVSAAVIEQGPGLYSLVATPLSGTEKAFLPPPDKIVLDFWDRRLESTHRKDFGFVLDDPDRFRRYIFRFEDGIEFATCMELFFAAKRVALRRDRDVDRLRRQALSLVAST